MESQAFIPIPTELLLKLVNFLKESHDSRNPDIFIKEIIQEQLVKENCDSKLSSEMISPNAKGYLWGRKNIWLVMPHGTLLRMRYKGKYHYASVDGDEINYEGRSVSPAYLVNYVTRTSKGLGIRNAWKDLWIKAPSDTKWNLADDCRNRLSSEFEGS